MASFSSDKDGTGPLARGRELYYQKDYAGAREAFTEAVRISTGHLRYTALDHRAAALQKLGSLQPALKDAKQMIDLMPELAKGYLRCGQVLQLKEQNQLALKIYERGLAKVKIGTDDDRVKLQSMYNKLLQSQNKDKCRDPLVHLPTELAQMVCEHLEMRDRVICLAVSKPWKRLLESSHRLWTTLDTTSTRKPVSQKSLMLHFKRSNYSVDRAHITFRATFDQAKWQYLFTACKQLKMLSIHGNGFIGDSLSDSIALAGSLQKLCIGASCVVAPSTIFVILQACRKTLIEVAFLRVKAGIAFTRRLPEPCELLECLQLRAVNNCAINADILCLSAPNVTTLQLYGCNLNLPDQGRISDFSRLAALERLEHLELLDAALPSDITNFPPNLKYLSVSRNVSLRKISTTNPAQFQPPLFSLLETFDCSHTELSGESIISITAASIKAGNLRTLRLGGRYAHLPTIPITYEYPASETVEEISLVGCAIPEPQMMAIVALYPNLKRVDLSFTKVTGVAVKACVGMGVRWMDLRGCTAVGVDAVEWARSKGVEVVYSFTEDKLMRSHSFGRIS